MDLSSLRRLVSDINFDTHGIPVTVTPLNDFPVEAKGIWLLPETEQLPSGSDFQRSNAKRIMAIRVDAVPGIPRKSTVTIAVPDDFDEVWIVDGIPIIDTDHYHVTLVRES